MGRSETLGAAWPAFMAYLATLPPPDDVAAALVAGPLLSYGAKAASIHRRDDNSITIIGAYGYDGPEVARTQSVPLTVDMPVTVACRRNELVIGSISSAIHEYSGMSLDPDIWGDLDQRHSGGSYVVAPIAIRGRCIGTYNFTFAGQPEFDASDMSSFLGLGALLGLWLSHPSTNALAASRNDSAIDTRPLTLSARQIQILQLAATGRSNPAIAAKLGYSVSTVKQELSRIMDTLRVDNRLDAIKRAQALELIGSDGEAARAGR